MGITVPKTKYNGIESFWEETAAGRWSFFSMLQYVSLGNTARVSGVTVFSYRISIPSWEEKTKMTEFYQKISLEAEEFCQSKLIPLAEGDFSASEDPNKRFRYAPFFYTLSGRVTGEKEGILSVLLEAKWGRRGEKELLGQGFDAHTWEWQEENLLPPAHVTRRLSLQRIRRKDRRRCRGVFLDGETIRLCFSKELKEAFFDRKRMEKPEKKPAKKPKN